MFERGRSLYTMNADGSNQKKLPNTAHYNYEIDRYGSYGGNPAFSPSRRKIIFDEDKNIYTPNVDGSNPTRITDIQTQLKDRGPVRFSHVGLASPRRRI